MGQFGLHQMLITPAGSAGRLGSLPTTAVLEPSPRSEQPACLYRLDASCTACVDNCPVSALKLDGAFDRQECWDFCLENERWNGKADCCGKCLSVVPCTYIDPVASKLAKAAAR
jgi:epoxyqueuosine reductase QueG